MLRRLVCAQFLAETGDGIITVALPLYVFARTGSATATALTLTAEMLAGAVFGVIGGIASDRFHRQRVLVCSFAARIALLVVTVAVGPLWLSIAFGVAARALGQLDNPAFDAIIPALADDDLQQVLAVRRFIQAVSVVIGPAIGALAVWAIGARSTIALASCFFVVAIVIHTRIHGVDPDHAKRTDMHSVAGLGELIAGMTIVFRTPFVRRLVTYQALAMALVAVALASALVWFNDELDVGDYWYGLSVSGYGIGASVGLLIFGGREFTMSLPKVILASAPLYAIACAVGVVAEVPWLMAIGWLMWGIAMGPEIVRGEPEFVGRIAPDMRGRAFAGAGVATTLGAALGFAVAGPLLETFGARHVTLGTALALLGLGAIWIGPTRHGLPPAECFDLDDEQQLVRA